MTNDLTLDEVLEFANEIKLDDWKESIGEGYFTNIDDLYIFIDLKKSYHDDCNGSVMSTKGRITMGYHKTSINYQDDKIEELYHSIENHINKVKEAEKRSNIAQARAIIKDYLKK